MDRIFIQLQQIQCPFQDPVDFLVQNRWIELVAWLLRSYDSNLFNRLCVESSKGTTSDPNEMQSFCVLLGLCSSRSKDTQLNTLKLQDRIKLLTNLVDMVVRNGKFEETKDRILLSEIIPEFKSLTSPAVQLFPQDMSPIFSTNSSSLESNSVPLTSAQIESRIKEEYLKSKQRLEQMELELSSSKHPSKSIPNFNAENQNNNSQPALTASQLAEIKTSILEKTSKLAGLIDQFQVMYSSDIKPWNHIQSKNNDYLQTESEYLPKGSNGKFSSGNELKQECLEDVVNMTISLQNTIGDIKKVKTEYRNIITMERVGIVDMMGGISEQLILEAQDHISILNDAVTRRKEMNAEMGV